MELYHLRTFLAVAESRHVTRAAESLHISQSSVSTHIKTLEEELGLTLFIRTPKGMKLSPDGRSISQEATLAVQAADAVFHKADQLKKNLPLNNYQHFKYDRFMYQIVAKNNGALL